MLVSSWIQSHPGGFLYWTPVPSGHPLDTASCFLRRAGFLAKDLLRLRLYGESWLETELPEVLWV